MQAVELGQGAISGMCVQMEAWAAKIGKRKRGGLVLQPEGLSDQISAMVSDSLKEAYMSLVSKDARNQVEAAAEKKVMAALAGQEGGPTDVQISLALKEVKSAAMRGVVLEHGRRMDGRGLTDVRVITSRAAPLKRTHGSALFTRGETQVWLVVLVVCVCDWMV